MKNRRIQPTIEMIPLIDVMFLLLIFFIYAALNIASLKQLPVELPETMQALRPEKDYLQLIIGQEKLLLNETPIDLQNIAEIEKNKKVYVAADQNIAYGRVAEVLAALSSAGIEKISLETK